IFRTSDIDPNDVVGDTTCTDMCANGASSINTVAGVGAIAVCNDIADLASVAVGQHSCSIHLACVISVGDRIGEKAAIRLQHDAVGAVVVCRYATHLDVIDGPDAGAEYGLVADVATYGAVRD